MLIKRTVILSALSLAAATSWCATLTRNGKASSVIVVPDKGARVCQDAAELLQRTLARMSGATIPIQSESKVNGPASPERVWLSVGDTRFARSKGVAPDKWKPEEIRLAVTPTYI